MLNYSNRSVVITGAGHGIGKAHALCFARRGAAVVVNDIQREAADTVVAEIFSAGGRAVANYDSVVEGADAIIATALKHFDRLDVLVNNAGIGVGGEDGAGFAVHAMGDADWQRLLDVHLNGTFRCSRAALKVMSDQGYGRIISTGSPVGFFGAANASHYSAAKIAVFGLMQCIALENHDKDITANTLSPVAASEMTMQYYPQHWLDAADANYVAEFAAWLGHESCDINGQAFEVGGGFIHQLRMTMSGGIELDKSDYCAEAIAEKFNKFSDFDNSFSPKLGDINTVVNKINARAKEDFGINF